MKKIQLYTIVLLVCLCCSLDVFTSITSATTYQTDGSSQGVQAAANVATDGDTIIIPSGKFLWSNQVIITKGLKIQGQGSGELIGCSKTPKSINTGPASFQIEKVGYTNFNVGDTIKVIATVNGGNWMRGQVTALTQTDVTINVSQKNGTGTWRAWTFLREGNTEISNTTKSVMLSLRNTSPSNYIHVTGIHFTGTLFDGTTIDVRPNVNHGKTSIFSNCRFSENTSHIRFYSVNGLVYNCSFDCGFNSGAGSGYGNDTEALQLKGESETWSWNSNSTLGQKDTDGLTNFYVEDCYFSGMALKSMDLDDNSRAVVRYNIFDNSGIVSHGPDTSTYGSRHFEIYNNTFVFSVEGTSPAYSLTYNINWWFWMRGGSGVITENYFPDMYCQWWGSRPSLSMTVQNLRRNAGPYACWTTYPSPHQVGQGFEGGKYTLDSLYIWNNMGDGVNKIVIGDYSPDTCNTGASSVNFIVLNRDYFVGINKPNWQKFTYPHPLRQNITNNSYINFVLIENGIKVDWLHGGFLQANSNLMSTNWVNVGTNSTPKYLYYYFSTNSQMFFRLQ